MNSTSTTLDLQQLLDTLPLLPSHIADLERSGITEDQALAAGIRSVSDPATISKILNRTKPETKLGSCILFTFRDPAGNLIGDYARLKPDTPRKSRKQEDEGKPIKYESPAGKSNRAYFPVGIAAALVANDPILSSEPIIITEGEKKSLAATLAGFPTIGLVGVEGWSKKRDIDPETRRKIGERKLIDDLDGIAWQRRPVYIAYDSDAVHKQAVRRAELALAKALTNKGASVKIVRLPDLPSGEKCGLDDFLIAHSADELRKLIDAAEPFVPGATIAGIMIGADKHRVNSEAAAALTNDSTLYQTGNQLVRILRDAEHDDDRGIHRPAGPRIEPLPLPALRDRLTAVTGFKRLDKYGEEKPAHPPAWCVAAVAVRGQWPGVRPLDGVVPFPILRRDGSILATHGYDRASRLYLDWPHPALPLIERPNRHDAIAAADSLLEVVGDFPFQSPVHKSAWLAALLTPLARNIIDGPTPLFLVDANVRAAGKGKLLDVAAMIVLGTRMVVATYPRDEDELRKKITACLVRGDRLVMLDNLTGQFGNGTLDALLTSTHWRDRILGESRMYDGPALATWFGTGNNVSIGADTARRVCHIRLESDLERPEDRSGFRHPDLLSFVSRERPRLLAAALTILRAYIIAGKPDNGLKPWGSYESWSSIIRDALVWIGQPDPGETRELMQESADTTAAAMRSFLAALEMIDPERVGLTAAEIIKRTYAEYPTDPADVVQMLRDSIDTLTAKPEPRLLGFKLRSHKRRIFGGLYLDTVNEARAGFRWAAFSANSFRQLGETYPPFPHVRTPDCGDADIADQFHPNRESVSATREMIL